MAYYDIDKQTVLAVDASPFGVSAIVFGIEHFRLFLLGHQFELETNHKPLEVFSDPSSTPPAPVQRWMLRLQEYSFTVKFKRGIHNPADWMGRQIEKLEDRFQR